MTENIQNQQIKERILKIFQESRKDPSQVFDTSHFMDYLASPPAPKYQLRNSFLGARKFGNFIKKIELEFAICFKDSGDESVMSLDEFTAKVIERMSKKQSNLQIIRARQQEKNYFIFEIIMLLIISILYAVFGVHWLPILLSFPIALAVYWITSARISDKIHTAKLSKKIELLAKK